MRFDLALDNALDIKDIAKQPEGDGEKTECSLDGRIHCLLLPFFQAYKFALKTNEKVLFCVWFSQNSINDQTLHTQNEAYGSLILAIIPWLDIKYERIELFTIGSLQRNEFR